MMKRMIDLASGILSSITRRIAFIPGMYIITRPVHKIFTRYYSHHADEALKTIALNGYRIKLNISHRIAAVVYWRGAQEWAPMHLLQKVLKPGMVVYDIGANMGEVTLFAAHRIGEKGKVIAFEPMNEAFELLQYNVRLNGFEDRVDCINTALSDQTGELNLYAAGGSDPLGSFEDGLHTLFPSHDRNLFLQKVKVEKLDDKINELPAPDIIKIDVEGAELFVLMGAVSILKKYHPRILIEINMESYQAAGYEQGDVFDFLLDLGYEISIIRNRGRLKAFVQGEKFRLANIYCYQR